MARTWMVAVAALAWASCDDGGPTPEVAADRGGARDAAPPTNAPPPAVDAAQTPADARAPVIDAAPLPDAAPSPVDAAPQSDAAPQAPPVDAAPVDAAPDAAPEPDPGAIRFAALGDVGKGNAGQMAVGAALADVCADRGGCDFALLLGDNIYDTGVDDADDPQWQTKFEQPYADVDFPFYAALGNHDYGAPEILQDIAGGIGIDSRRGQAQLDYAASQDKFRMPDTFYKFEEGPVEIVCLNTAALFWRDLEFIELLAGFHLVNAEQEQRIPEWNAASRAPWRLAFGHHPYLSNGRHGNAASYDFVFIEGLIGSGTGIRDFYEDHVIGEFDVLMSGHDHSLQDLGRVDGTNIIVSGAGASTTDVVDNRNDFVWQSQERGFVLVEADADEMTFHFIEVAENPDAEMPWRISHSRTIRH